MSSIGSAISVAPFAGAWIEIQYPPNVTVCFLVAPFAGAWIEILSGVKWSHCELVAPFAGAWIEIIDDALDFKGEYGSLPSRERGLKSCLVRRHEKLSNKVAPFAGAWIEIVNNLASTVSGRSLPSRERGLKLDSKTKLAGLRPVAPFAGAWIEIQYVQ